MCRCNQELLPVRNTNVQQYCICGDYYKINDYEGTLQEEGFHHFIKDITVVQDYVMETSTASAKWMQLQLPLEKDLNKLKTKIKLYITLS